MPSGPLSKQLAETLLGESLDPWLTLRRERGDSWQTIAQELRDVTAGRASFSAVTVRSWSDEPVVSKAGAEVAS